MKPPASPTPRPCVITALEMLGLDEPSVLEQKLRLALAFVKSRLGDMDIPQHEKHLLVIGHRVFRTAPIKPGGTILFWELLDVVHLQAELFRHGVWLRGIVMRGNAAGSAGTAVGSGLSEAERLCGEIAEVPRVIVDPQLLQETESNPELRAPHHTVPMELGYIRGLLRDDSDGLWFVDYLKAFSTEIAESYTYPDFLEEHRQRVERGLGASTTFGRSSRAWTWLWSYHNRVIEESFEQKQLDERERARLFMAPVSRLLYVFPPSAKVPVL
jgi:hypothetical protein